MEKDNRTLKEKFAEKIHIVWAEWMLYVFQNCKSDVEGNMIIPKDLVKRWKRQSSQTFDELTEEEKFTDKKIAGELNKIVRDSNEVREIFNKVAKLAMEKTADEINKKT